MPPIIANNEAQQAAVGLRPGVSRACVRCGHELTEANWSCARCQYAPLMIDGLLTFAPEITDTEECYNQEIVGELARLEEQNFWFKARNQLILWALSNHFPNAKNFFEVGCGSGYVLNGVANAHPKIELYGCDALTASLVYARKRLPQAQLFQMDARNMPFFNSFDVAGAFDVIEHVKEDREVLAQMHASLRPGGGLLLTVPQHKRLWSRCDDFVHHVRRYRQCELIEKVEQAGFRVVRVTSFVSLLLPILVGSRIWQHISPRPYDLVSELKVQGTVGGMLEAVLNVERACIAGGFNWPVGGSILLVAERI